MIIKFECTIKNGNKIRKWKCVISKIIEYENYYEIQIEAYSNMLLVFGKISSSGFLCMPDYGIGCRIAGLNDKYWNIESLLKVLGEVDAITVAEALYTLRNILKF